jgi:hypothetical protein
VSDVLVSRVSDSGVFDSGVFGSGGLSGVLMLCFQSCVVIFARHKHSIESIYQQESKSTTAEKQEGKQGSISSESQRNFAQV